MHAGCNGRKARRKSCNNNTSTSKPRSRTAKQQRQLDQSIPPFRPLSRPSLRHTRRQCGPAARRKTLIWSLCTSQQQRSHLTSACLPIRLPCDAPAAAPHARPSLRTARRRRRNSSSSSHIRARPRFCLRTRMNNSRIQHILRRSSSFAGPCRPFRRSMFRLRMRRRCHSARCRPQRADHPRPRSPHPACPSSRHSSRHRRHSSNNNNSWPRRSRRGSGSAFRQGCSHPSCSNACLRSCSSNSSSHRRTLTNHINNNNTLNNNRSRAVRVLS